MKTYLKTWLIGGYYQYQVFKVVDGAGRIYYLAEPMNRGATRIADTEETLRQILEADNQIMKRFQQRIK
jgi:hypothetical protein